MSVDRVARRFNGVVQAVLRSPLHWPLSAGLTLITVTGRRSRRVYTIPVGYQQDGDLVTILASEAPNKQWWRNFEEPAPVALRLRGREVRGRAILLKPRSEEFRNQCERTLRRLPFMARVFGLTDYRRREGVTAPQLATLGEQVAIVQVRLAPD